MHEWRLRMTQQIIKHLNGFCIMLDVVLNQQKYDSFQYFNYKDMIMAARTEKTQYQSLRRRWNKLRLCEPTVCIGSLVHFFDGLVRGRRNSIANALELRLSCINLSISSWRVCCFLNVKPVPEPVLTFNLFEPLRSKWKKIPWNLNEIIYIFVHIMKRCIILFI